MQSHEQHRRPSGPETSSHFLGENMKLFVCRVLSVVQHRNYRSEGKSI